MKAKILEMCPFMNLGGTERHLLILSRELRGRFDLSIAASQGPARSNFEDDGFHMVDYPEALSFSPQRAMAAVGQVRALIHQESPDLVHVHAAREMVAMVRLVSRSVPMVFTPHAYASAFDFATTALFARLADRVICVSEWEKSRLDRFLGARAETLTVMIHNGIPLPGAPMGDFTGDTPAGGLAGGGLTGAAAVAGPAGTMVAQAPNSQPAHNLTLGCVARLHWAKGIDVLVKAFAGLVGEYPRLKLVIVGDGEEREKIQGLADRLGAGDRVRFTGGLPNPAGEVRNWDIFVLPSFKEALPIAVIEAMSEGKPVVSTTVGGIPEVVQHGRTGLLCKPGDVFQLKEAIRALIQSPSLRTEYGMKARERVRELFSASRMAEMTGGVYEETIAARAAGR